MTRENKILNWLNSEKKKDEIEIANYKKKVIEEMKGFQKGDFFKKPKKLTLWQKIKIMILGS